MYNELLAQYYLYNCGRLIRELDEVKDEKFINKRAAATAYLQAYDDMLNTMVKRPKNT